MSCVSDDIKICRNFKYSGWNVRDLILIDFRDIRDFCPNSLKLILPNFPNLGDSRKAMKKQEF